MSISVKLCARPATSAPTKKSTIEMMMSGRRPKILDRVAVLGWKTVLVRMVDSKTAGDCIPVEQRRNEVPLQKASIAEPFSSAAIFFHC